MALTARILLVFMRYTWPNDCGLLCHRYQWCLSLNNFIPYTNMYSTACQGHVQRSHPATIRLLREEKPWLSSALASSCADWKIVFGHHPMYTKGNGHQATALCLRENSYTCEKYNRRTGIVEHVQYDGFGMADVMVSGGADLYISGK